MFLETIMDFYWRGFLKLIRKKATNNRFFKKKRRKEYVNFEIFSPDLEKPSNPKNYENSMFCV